MGTVAEKGAYLNGTKAAIKTAIEAKGVSVGNATFREYAAKIAQISGGGGARVIDHGEKEAHIYHAITDWVMGPTYAGCTPSFASGLYLILQTDGAGGYLDPREASYAAHAIIVYLTRTVELEGTEAEVCYMAMATYTQDQTYEAANFDVGHEYYADYAEMAEETPATSASTAAAVKRRQTDPEGTYHIWEVELP